MPPTDRRLPDSSRGSLSAVTLRVLAVSSISLGAAAIHPALAATAAGCGLILHVWSLRCDPSIGDRHAYRWAGLAVVLIFITVPALADRVPHVGRAARLWQFLLILAAGLAVGWGHRRIARLISIATALLAVLALTLFMTVDQWRSDFGVDVYWMHRSAGAAMLQGENPYTEAVRVFNGSPYAPEGSTIEGYPYPPVVLGTYAATAMPADPRLVSMVAWLAVLAWIAWRATRMESEGDAPYAMFLLMAGFAVWPVVWFASWTEPLSVGLLLLTAIWWRRRPVWSAITLGLAIASKQYLIFLAPLLLLQKGEQKAKRLIVSAGVAAVTVLIGLVPDPGAYVNATIVNLSEIGFRPDSQSLSGLLALYGHDFNLAPAVWLALGLALAAVVSRGAKSAADFVGRSGLILGLAFFFGPAFVNYWFLVAVLIAVSALLPVDGVPAEGDEALPAARPHPTGRSSASKR